MLIRDDKGDEEMKKTIFVTGASSGLGKATAELFLQKGWNVVAALRNPSKGNYFKNHKNGLVVELDVTNSILAKEAVAKAVDKLGQIDVLFNAAGYGAVFLFEDNSEEYFKKQMDTNFYGTVNTTRAVMPFMRKQRSGHIINVTSVAGKAGIPFQTGYVASKHAVSGFTNSLAYEVKEFGIKASIFEVGGMNTGFVKAMDNATEVVIDDYKDFFVRVNKKLGPATENAYKNAPTPDIIAKKVLELVEMKKPPVFFRPTRDSKIMEFLRRVLPTNQFRKVTSMGLD